MKRAAVLVSALAVVLYTVGISAQAKPNFAGTWVMEAPAAPAAPPAGGGGGGGRGGGRGGGAISGMEVTIVQDATTLTINKTQGGGGGGAPTPVTLKYTLDGKDSKNTTMGRGGEVVATSQAVWDGAKLTITTTADQGRGPTTTKQSIWMEGGNIVVEIIKPN